MAIVAGSGAGLVTAGIPEGIYLIYFMTVMLVVWGVTGVCPALFIMKKLGVKDCA